jgi:3-hydroxyisobutyrate dehydrogenase-like beta-hydroxyacid dehydrogenase
MSKDTSPLGIIGLGLLGTALAQRLQGAGYPIVGHDVDPHRSEACAALGIRTVTSASDVAARCPRMLLCLPTRDHVTSVVSSLSGTWSEGTILLDATTGDPQSARRLATELADRGVEYLDTTVAGSSAQAREGQIILMIGGPANAVNRCTDLFNTLAKGWYHVGPSGSGSTMKLVVNLVLGLNRAVLAEALQLAIRSGLDPAETLEVLRAGPAFSTVMDTKGQKMIDRDFDPQARLAQHHKDVELILELGRAHDARLPLSHLHEELLRELIQQGLGPLDNSAVIRAFETK